MDRATTSQLPERPHRRPQPVGDDDHDLAELEPGRVGVEHLPHRRRIRHGSPVSGSKVVAGRSNSKVSSAERTGTGVTPSDANHTTPTVVVRVGGERQVLAER